ncbi:hypothetical protein FLCH110379_16245 [Flavobacterium chungbukense]
MVVNYSDFDDFIAKLAFFSPKIENHLKKNTISCDYSYNIF